MIVNRHNPFLVLILLLFTSKVSALPQNLLVNSISIPAWNIVTDTLFVMTPEINGKRNDFLMNMVCGLARGDITQQEVNNALIAKRIDIAGIPLSGSPLSMLVNGNIAQQETTCAAYLASSLFLPVDNHLYFDKKIVQAPRPVEAKKSFWQKLINTNTTSQPVTNKEEYVLNKARFEQKLKEKTALIQATAQLYAVIANNINNTAPVSYATYQKRVAEIVRNYAGEYLRSIKQFYISQNKNHITKMSVTMDGFYVENSSGQVLQGEGRDLHLSSRGVEWFGAGKVLGKEYFVDVAIIAAPATAEGKAQTKPQRGKSKK